MSCVIALEDEDVKLYALFKSAFLIRRTKNFTYSRACLIVDRSVGISDGAKIVTSSSGGLADGVGFVGIVGPELFSADRLAAERALLPTELVRRSDSWWTLSPGRNRILLQEIY